MNTPPPPPPSESTLTAAPAIPKKHNSVSIIILIIVVAVGAPLTYLYNREIKPTEAQTQGRVVRIEEVSAFPSDKYLAATILDNGKNIEIEIQGNLIETFKSRLDDGKTLTVIYTDRKAGWFGVAHSAVRLSWSRF